VDKIFIIPGARTPFGRFGGSLKTLTAPQLCGKAIQTALQRAKFGSD